MKYLLFIIALMSLTGCAAMSAFLFPIAEDVEQVVEKDIEKDVENIH